MTQTDRPRPVALAAPFVLLSLALSIARLVGEVQGWAPTDPGGALYPLGVSWLIPVFGAYAGWRIGRAGPVPGAARRVPLLALAGTAVLIGSVGLTIGAGFGPPVAYPVATLVGWAAVWVVVRAWSGLGAPLLAFAVGSRTVVVLVTVVALLGGWDTHYVVVGDGAYTPGSEALLWGLLVLVQVGLWMPATVLLGALFGAVVSLLAARRPR